MAVGTSGPLSGTGTAADAARLADGEPAPEPGAGRRSPSTGIDPDDLPDGLVVADEHGRVICFNAAAARITAVARRRRPRPRPGRGAAARGPRRAAAGGSSPTRTAASPPGSASPSGTCCCPAAARCWSPPATYATRPTGPVRRLVVSLRGTEARRRTERSHAELIATVAHELRSPLTSVKGFTATLLAKWERFTDDQKRLMLETVDADANRVTRLIAELLDISRIDSGRLELRRQPVDIGRRRRTPRPGARRGRPAPPTASCVRIGEPLPALWADPDKVDQVLGNLLENAVRHGEGTVTIEVAPARPRRAGATRHGTAVTVSDEGPGIPEESMSRVFTRFWRGSKRGGTGLGLYIVKGIVEAHGGTITVGRAPGGGAEFRFILPVGTPAYLAADAGEAPRARRPPPRAPLDSAFGTFASLYCGPLVPEP